MNMLQRKISILGSTGSIGTQALQLASLHPNRFKVVALTAHRNKELLFDQVRKYRPQMAGLSMEEVEVPKDLHFCDWYFGEEALIKAAEWDSADDVLVSVVGMVGLRAVLSARAANKRVLLANKEALVAGGEIVMNCSSLQADRPSLIPVDSEHSAVYQCLLNAGHNPFHTIWLTASGGPFRTWEPEKICTAKKEEALAHPNWSMGSKITIDSASMFNKALEMVEARWLFDAKPQQIKVLIHPQSIVHSMVEFEDGAFLAQLGSADMRVPIAFAMAYPERITTEVKPLHLSSIASLLFEEPDLKRFPPISLAYQVLEEGGLSACVMNAANEVAVQAFLEDRIQFGDIYRVVESTLNAMPKVSNLTFESVIQTDMKARQIAMRYCRE